MTILDASASWKCYPQSFTDFLHCRRIKGVERFGEFLVVELHDVVDQDESDG